MLTPKEWQELEYDREDDLRAEALADSQVVEDQEELEDHMRYWRELPASAIY